MRVSVDEHLCSGQGRCYSLSPDLFTADDEGFCEQRGTELDVPAGLEEQAELGLRSCPEGAIAVVVRASTGN